MAERVVVTQGATTTEFTYSDYKDWNNPLNKIEVFYAGKMIERRNGAVVRDLTTERDGDGQRVCGRARAGQRAEGDERHRRRSRAACSRSTEPPVEQVGAHAAAGRASRPDGQLGVYSDWIGNYMTGGGRRCGPTQETDCNRATNQTEDFELYSPSRFGKLGRPLYKPEHWDKVQQLDMWTNKYDPVMTCQPLGVPRQGPPRRIYQTENDITFLYREAMPAADTASFA